MKIKKMLLTLSTILVLALILAACGSKPAEEQQQTKVNYPEKTIKIIGTLPEQSAPGFIAKKISSIMSEKHGWNFEYEYDSVDQGGSAMNKVWNAPHDGYTILSHTESVFGPPVYGSSTHTSKDWKFLTSIQVGTGIFVRTDLGYDTIEDLVNAAKENPGKISMSVSSKGTAFHLKIKALEKITGAQFDIKYNIGGTGRDEQIENKTLDAFISPTQGVMELIDKGLIKPIIMTELEAHDFGGDIGTVGSIVDSYPEYSTYLPLDSLISFAIPSDVPKEVFETFENAFEEAINSPEITELVRQTDSILLGLSGDDATGYMSDLESNYAWLTTETDLVKVHPETLGIPKPE